MRPGMRIQLGGGWSFCAIMVTPSRPMDLFTAPTLTFEVLYCLFVIDHDRRRILPLNVTQHPNAHWVALQLRHTWG